MGSLNLSREDLQASSFLDINSRARSVAMERWKVSRVLPSVKIRLRSLRLEILHMPVLHFVPVRKRK